MEKCTETKHYPDWNDCEISEIDEKEITIECNCECLSNCYMRTYSNDGEYILKGDEYVPIPDW